MIIHFSVLSQLGYVFHVAFHKKTSQSIAAILDYYEVRSDERIGVS